MTQENIRAHGMDMHFPEKRNDEGKTRTLYQNEFYSGSLVSLNHSSSTENETYTKITFRRYPDYTTFNIQHSLNSRKIAIPEKHLEGNDVHIIADYPFLALYVGDNEFYPFDTNGIAITEEKLPLRISDEKTTRSSLTQTPMKQEFTPAHAESRKGSNISVGAQTNEPGPSSSYGKQTKKPVDRALRTKPEPNNYHPVSQNTATSYSQHGINEMAYEMVDKHKTGNQNDFGEDLLSPIPKVYVPISKADIEKKKRETDFGNIVEANPSRDTCIEKWNSHTNVATKQKRIQPSSRKQSANPDPLYQYSHSPQNMFDQLNESIKHLENTQFYPNRSPRLPFKYEEQKPLVTPLESFRSRGSTNLVSSYDVANSCANQECPTYSDEFGRGYSQFDDVYQPKHYRISVDDRKTGGYERDRSNDSSSPRNRYVNKDSVRSYNSLRGKVAFAFQDHELPNERKPQRSENDLNRRYSDYDRPDTYLTKITSPRVSPVADINLQTPWNDMSTQTNVQSEKAVEKKKAVRSPISILESATSTTSGNSINRAQYLTPEPPKVDVAPTIKGLQHMNSVLLRIQNELRPIQTDMKELQSKLLHDTSNLKRAGVNTQQKDSFKTAPEKVHNQNKERENHYDLHEITDPVLKAKTKFPSGVELLEELSKQIIARTHDTRGKIIHSERNLKEAHTSKNPHNYPT